MPWELVMCNQRQRANEWTSALAPIFSPFMSFATNNNDIYIYNEWIYNEMQAKKWGAECIFCSPNNSNSSDDDDDREKKLRSQLIGHKTLVISSSLELRNCFFPYNWCYCCCFDYLTIAVVEWWQHRFCVHENMHLLFWRVPRWKINEKKQMAAHTTTIFKGRTTFFPPRSNIAPSIDRKLGFIFSLSKGAY